MFKRALFFVLTLPFLVALAPPAEGGDQNPLLSLLPFVLIILIFFFLVIRPQQKKAKAHRQLLSELKKGDKVATVSGIFGKVEKVAADEGVVQMTIADKCVVKIAKSSITEVLDKKNTVAASTKDKKNTKQSSKKTESAENQNNEQSDEDNTSAAKAEKLS